MFNQIKSDENDYIDYTEFLAAAFEKDILISEKYLKEAFNFFDTVK